MKETLLQVKNLAITYQTNHGPLRAVKDLNFTINRGETLAIVGESGSGKTATALSMIGLLPDNGRMNDGSIVLNGEPLIGKTEKEWGKIRGKQVSMIFQDPMSALNPVLTIGRQLEECIYLRKEKGLTKDKVRTECINLLKQVGVTEPEMRLKQYPHQLSGGIRQRVMIAIALASKPELLIADEPTTALDSTIKKQILQLLARLKKEFNLSVLLITHDLAETITLADNIIVMYGGKMVEFGTANEVLKRPEHPYTESLLQAFPRMDDEYEHDRLFSLTGQPPNLLNLPKGCSFHPRCPYAKEKCQIEEPSVKIINENGHKVSCLLSKEERIQIQANMKKVEDVRKKKETIKIGEPVLEVIGLKKYFSIGKMFAKKQLKAVDDVNFTIGHGEIMALVGESGCGKSTLWQTAVGVYKPTAGKVNFLGKTIHGGRDWDFLHKNVGFVFQNCYSSLNPRMRISEAILEVLNVGGWQGAERKNRVYELLELVGIPADKSDVLPHQLSGGQRQRVAIARALANHPKLIIADEPVSSLDVSIQAQIINLLKDLQEQFQLSMLFISHDLPLVKHMANQVIVMYGGRIVEKASSEEIFQSAKHPYTKVLIASATPTISQQHRMDNEVENTTQLLNGCPFYARCTESLPICKTKIPTLKTISNNHQVACHLVVS